MRRRPFIAALAAPLLLSGCGHWPAPAAAPATSPVAMPVPAKPAWPTPFAATDASTPSVPPPILAPVVPAVALPTDCHTFAFTSEIDGHAKLMLFDDRLKEVHDLPGAGEDMEDPQLTAVGIGFERGGLIEVYDPATELSHKLDAFDLFLGQQKLAAFEPSFTWDGRIVTALSDPTPGATISTPCGTLQAFQRALVSVDGQVQDLAKLEGIAATEDGITRLRVSPDGKWLVFTSGLGDLYVVDWRVSPTPCLLAVLPSSAGFAYDFDVSPDGNLLVGLVGIPTFDANDRVVSVSRVRAGKLDKAASCWDFLPYLNLAENAEQVCDPRFCVGDPARVLFEAVIPQPVAPQTLLPPTVSKVLEYDWKTEAVRAMAVLNSVNAVTAGDNTISTP